MEPLLPGSKAGDVVDAEAVMRTDVSPEGTGDSSAEVPQPLHLLARILVACNLFWFSLSSGRWLRHQRQEDGGQPEISGAAVPRGVLLLGLRPHAEEETPAGSHRRI